MPPTRVGHKKSRFGCIRCKQRHVKCDEQRPCGNCTRHHAECSLVLSTLSLGQSAHTSPAARLSGTSPALTGNHTSDASQSPSTLAVPTRPSYAPDQPVSSSTRALLIRAKVSSIREALLDLTDEVDALEHTRSQTQTPNSQRQDVSEIEPLAVASSTSTYDWLGDLNLLYHYISTDGLSLSSEDRQHELWLKVIPQLAFGRESLMHGMLALSALHLAHLHPDKKHEYAAQSARHQETALSRLRNVLFDVTEENCTEHFILAYMVMIFTFCSIGSPIDDMHSLDVQELGQSLFLGSGIMNLVTVPNIWQCLKTGPLECILSNPRPYSEPTGPFASRLDHISNAIAQTMAAPEAAQARTSCTLANDALKRVYADLLAGAGAGARDASPVMTWPIVLPSDFREFIGRRCPVALVVLAHYAALVKCFSDRWYLGRWSERVFEALEEALEEPWRRWLVYPKGFGVADLDEAIRAKTTPGGDPGSTGSQGV